MSKINFGPVVNDARGKVNGTVFSKNRSGAYIRKKVTPNNPNTLAQQNARSILSQYSQGWSGTLNASDRAAWNSFAATYPITDIFGASINLNGLNMYVRLNAAIAQAGASPLTVPPASPATSPIPIDPTSFTAVSGAVAISFDQTAAAPAAGSLFYIFATPLLPAGRKPQSSSYRFIGTVTPASTAFPVPTSIATLWQARFGTVIMGLNLAILVSTIDPTIGVPTLGVPMAAIVG